MRVLRSKSSFQEQFKSLCLVQALLLRWPFVERPRPHLPPLISLLRLEKNGLEAFQAQQRECHCCRVKYVSTSCLFQS